MKSKKRKNSEDILVFEPQEEGARTLYLMEQAFLGLVISSIEVYKKECLGLIVGTRHNGLYVAENAIAFQAAERGTSSASVRGHYHDRIIRFLNEVIHLEPLGYFHSHPGYDVIPSEEDVSVLQDQHINMIVGVNKKRKEVPWNYNVDESLSGTIEDFIIKLRGFYRDPATGRIRLARLNCPFALGFRR